LPGLKTDVEEALQPGLDLGLQPVGTIPGAGLDEAPRSDQLSRLGVWTGLRHAAILLLTALAAVAVTGYHPYGEDAGIYVAGIKQATRPELYGSSAAFLTPYLQVSLFPRLSARLIHSLHLPLEDYLLAMQVLTTWLLLFACWGLAKRCFDRSVERWGALLVTAVCLPLPVAGSSLFMMDPYLTSRSFSTPLSLLAISACLDRKYLHAAALLLLIGLFHPLMVIYAALFVLLLWAVQVESLAGVGALIASAFAAAAGVTVSQRSVAESAAYASAVRSRSYFFLSNWHWYELVGLAAPILIFALLSYWRSPSTPPAQIALARTCALLGLTSLLVAAIFARSSNHSHLVAALQPLRPFLLLYFCMFVAVGGVIGKTVLKRSAWRWMVLLAGTGAGLAFAQHQSYPGSAQLELPGAVSSNGWTRGFLWIRDNTPPDARFALDAEYIHTRGEDGQGFRAIAERDALADRVKDGGAAAVFRQLADRWWIEQAATSDLNLIDDAERLRRLTPFGVGWIVLDAGSPTLLHCPFADETIKVCRLH
jgi:hypothetical protein